jgi:chemotaxis protein CheX
MYGRRQNCYLVENGRGNLAIAELGNMLAANASIIFEQQGAKVNISPPTLITGESYASSAGSVQRLNVEIFVDQIPLEVNIAMA